MRTRSAGRDSRWSPSLMIDSTRSLAGSFSSSACDTSAGTTASCAQHSTAELSNSTKCNSTKSNSTPANSQARNEHNMHMHAQMRIVPHPCAMQNTYRAANIQLMQLVQQAKGLGRLHEACGEGNGTTGQVAAQGMVVVVVVAAVEGVCGGHSRCNCMDAGLAAVTSNVGWPKGGGEGWGDTLQYTHAPAGQPQSPTPERLALLLRLKA